MSRWRKMPQQTRNDTAGRWAIAWERRRALRCAPRNLQNIIRQIRGHRRLRTCQAHMNGSFAIERHAARDEHNWLPILPKLIGASQCGSERLRIETLQFHSPNGYCAAAEHAPNTFAGNRLKIIDALSRRPRSRWRADARSPVRDSPPFVGSPLRLDRSTLPRS